VNPMAAQEADVGGVSEAPWNDLIAASAREVFEIMVGSKLGPADASRQGQGGVTAMLGFAGKPCGVFTVRCPWAAAAAVAGRMLGVSPDELPTEQVCDAVGEICNMVAGSLKSRLNDAGAGCLMTTPSVIRGVDYEVRCLACDRCFGLIMEFEGHLLAFDLELQAS